MPILGLDSGYTVKYSTPPLEVPSGGVLYLALYPSSRPYVDTIILKLAKHSQVLGHLHTNSLCQET